MTPSISTENKAFKKLRTLFSTVPQLLFTEPILLFHNLNGLLHDGHGASRRIHSAVYSGKFPP